MLRLLELTYEDLVEFVADRYGKGSFLARTLYGQFYKHLDPDAWQAEIIRNSKGLKDRLRQDWRFSFPETHHLWWWTRKGSTDPAKII
jgi:hypothetical protein